MMLKTSSNKLNPAWRLFTFTLRKNVGLLVLICIMALLFSPGYLLTYITQEVEFLSRNDPAYIFEYNDILKSVITVTTVVTSIIAVLMNMINFSYIYSKKSSDVFHAIPLTRCELFFSRFVSGYVFSAVPMCVIYAATGLLMLMPAIKGDISILFVGLLYNIAIMLLCSAISMVFIICAGTAFDMLMSLAAFGGGGLLIAAIICMLCDEMLTGFNNNSREILEVASPFALCGYGLSDYIENAPDFNINYIWFFVKVIVLSAVFLAISALLYRRRKAEKAGDSYAYRFMYVISGIIISYIGAFGVGMIFSEGNADSILFFIFAAVGAVISAVTFGAISFRGFKTVKKSLIIGAVAFLCLVITYIIIITGGLRFSKRLPKTEGIKSAAISMNGYNYNGLGADDVIKLHQKIVEKEKDIKAYRKETFDYDSTDKEYSYFTNITIDYKLKNGRNMSRYFFIPIDWFENELLNVYTSEEMVEQVANILPENMENIYINYIFTSSEDSADTYYSVTLTQSEAEKLVEAYAKDIASATIMSITNENCDGLELSWTDSDQEDNWNLAYGRLQIVVEPHFTNTQAVIDEIDIIARIEAEKQAQLEIQK